MSYEISIIIPVGERYDNVRELHTAYKENIVKINKSFEFIYVLDGNLPEIQEDLEALQADHEELKIIKLAGSFGEAIAFNAGLANSSGDIILTLPAYFQVEPPEITKLINELSSYDMVIAKRWPRKDSGFNRIQTRVFHWLLKLITGHFFSDLGCGARAFKRVVAEEIDIYGDQYRFFPLLAARQGFRIAEVEIAQSSKEKYRRVYGPGTFVRRLLDIITIFFLVRFTKKPLRLFGSVGSITFLVGFVYLAYLIFERLFLNIPLADRPALILSSLLIVLGVQLFALGLIGELVIFFHASNMKDYTIEKTID